MITANQRRTVRTLYSFACGYCGVTEAEVGAYLTIDHYVPKAAGGTDDISNLVYACHACNLHKSSVWELGVSALLHPLTTDISQHIEMLPDGSLRSLTPEGSRHIEILHLNRPPLVERRKFKRLLEILLAIEEQRLKQNEQITQEVRRKVAKIRRKKSR